MTRIKRRYLIGRVRGGVVKEGSLRGGVVALLREVYGEVGVSTAAPHLALKWLSRRSQFFLFRVGADGYRRVRVCLGLLTRLGTTDIATSIHTSSGSLAKALSAAKREVKTFSNAKLQSIPLASPEADSLKQKVLTEMRQDLAELDNVSGF